VALTRGARLGPYEIAAQVGTGGMGEVYRATDTNLGRQVAIKVLPETLAQSADRLARFEREAKTLASLNHPNIAQIYGLERSPGTTALVMELVEGPTLADRIAQGPIPVEEALPIARQIADALEAAHEQGIIHRDLKPANVKVRSDGTVKVLDFGLAKAMEPAAGPSSSVSQSPTITTPAMTQAGMILGTAAYMSPEQARGKTVDKRADIWAFGCVLYEMLAGTRAFRGETVSETLAEVLKSEPPWTALPRETPAALRNIVRRCLDKDPRQRAHDIADVRLAMEGAFETAAAVEATAVAIPRLRVWQRPATAAVIAVSLIATAGLAVWALMRPAPAPPVELVRFAVSPPSRQSLVATNPNDPDVAISSDGTRIVYVAGDDGPDFAQHMYVRALDQLEARRLEGLENPRTPFLSPDGKWVGFFGEPNVLKKVTLNGGPAVTISKISGGPRGASWGPDDTIVFATNDPATGLFRVSAGGGEADVLTTPDAQKGELEHFWPEVLPGGKAVLFTILSKADATQHAQIALLDLQTGEQRVLVPGGSYPRYMPTGHIVYGVEGTLRAVAFDLGRLEVRSDPVPVLQRVVTKSSGAASFSVAQDGSLVYLARELQGGVERTLVWVDRKGREELLKAPPRAYTLPRISPDGTKVALGVRDQENDIWVWDLARATLTRLTFDRGVDTVPVWTPDGRRIAFSSTRGDATGSESNLYWQPADGTGAVERLRESAEPQWPLSFSRDGTRLLFGENGSTTGFDIGILPLEGERHATPLVQTTAQEDSAEVSPDGRWVAYQSNESGRNEIYVRPFPEVSGGRWQVSTGGGIQPLWGRDGRELFYLAGPGRLMATPIQPGAGATFAAGNPRVVFDGQYVSEGYDVSPNGQRFLMIKDVRRTAEGPPPSQLFVVQNWLEELKRLVPTR
jgi:eukaryotic-like serine/threonine-protein kinase